MRLIRSILCVGSLLLASAPLVTAAQSSAEERRVVITREQAGAQIFIGARVRGVGPLVVLLPSLGRDASDYDDLATRLAKAGYQTAAIDPRGAGDSRGSDSGLTVVDYVEDVAAVATQLSKRPSTFVGHTVSMRIVDALELRHPQLVSTLVMIGGAGSPPPANGPSPIDDIFFNTTITPEARMAVIKADLFAPTSDATVWRGGWYPAIAKAQMTAFRATAKTDLGPASNDAPILILQGAADKTAPLPREAFLKVYPGRRLLDMRVIADAGHAMIPEQPQAVADAIIAFLKVAVPIPAVTMTPSRRILFENQHIRLVEVTRWPGSKQVVEPEPENAIVVVDAPWPAVSDTPRNARAAVTEQVGKHAMMPDGSPYPWCQPFSPHAAHTVAVTGNFPQHFYRVEYKRVDGDDFAAHWREWYSWVFDPLPPPPVRPSLATAPYSKAWPYPLSIADVQASPSTYRRRYEDDHVQLVEVVVKPGETETLHGHPYPSIYLDDGAGPTKLMRPSTDPSQVQRIWSALEAGQYPACLASPPASPHEVSNPPDKPLQHFYRLQFKRVDGDDIKTQWRDWYPAPERVVVKR